MILTLIVSGCAVSAPDEGAVLAQAEPLARAHARALAAPDVPPVARQTGRDLIATLAAGAGW